MNRKTRILVLLTGDAIPEVCAEYGGFDHLYTQALHQGKASPPIEIQSIDLTALNERRSLPDPSHFHGIVMTGSPAMVSDSAPWMNLGCIYIREIIQKAIPFLGVCFGHQLMGLALGGSVGPNPAGREMGTIRVTRQQFEDPFLARLPLSFLAQVTHVEAILSNSKDLEIVGSAPHDPHHMVKGGPMAWGIQFHPEFSAEIIRTYLQARREHLESELGPGSFQTRWKNVAESDSASCILSQFKDFVVAHRLSSRPDSGG
jgi:GMP synthase (glutamine-hydrolysing)